MTFVRFKLASTGPALPASLFSLTAWCADLGDRSITPKTIKAYLCGLRSAHVDRGYSDFFTFEHPVLDRVIRGIKRARDIGIPREREPIRRELLLKILGTFDVFTQRGVTLHAFFCLVFAVFLRIGEFIWSSVDREADDFAQWRVTRASVVLHSHSLELTLSFSKTDPFRKGVTISVAATHDAACAVDSLRHLFDKFPTSSGSPLFEAAPGEAFTSESVTQVLRNALSRMGIKGHYFGHFFRRGAATEAREAGLPDSSIQLLGRWASDCYRLYVDTNKDFVLRASRRLQGH